MSVVQIPSPRLIEDKASRSASLASTRSSAVLGAGSEAMRVAEEDEVFGQVAATREAPLLVDRAPLEILMPPDRHTKHELFVSPPQGDAGIEIQRIARPPKIVVPSANQVALRDPVDPPPQTQRNPPRGRQGIGHAGARQIDVGNGEMDDGRPRYRRCDFRRLAQADQVGPEEIRTRAGQDLLDRKSVV